MGNSNYQINLNGTIYNWANATLNLNAINYLSQAVTSLSTDNNGGPIAWEVTLSNGGNNYTFSFAGGGGSQTVQITSSALPSPVYTTWTMAVTKIGVSYAITIVDTNYSWANTTFTVTAQYKGNNAVTTLTLNAGGAPVGFTVTLSHSSVNYTFVFTGGPGPSPIPPVTITHPALTATTDTDTWDAAAIPVPVDGN